jgi:ribosome-associated translation inhibitor RaiA
MSRTVDDPSVVQVAVVGARSSDERDYAVEKIESLTRYAPIRSARVALHTVGDPFDPQWAEAKVNLSGDGLFVHADARGESAAAAIDLVRQRLYRLLTHERHRPRHASKRFAFPHARRRG